MILKDPVQKVLVTQLGLLRLNSTKVLRSPAVEPLHDLRVAALRAGFALKFFKKFLSTANTDRLRDELARARRVMARKRDWDIFSSRIKKDFQVINTPSPLKRKLRQIVKAQKTQAHQDLVKMLRSPRYKKMLRDLKEISWTASGKRKLKPQKLLKGLMKGSVFAKTPALIVLKPDTRGSSPDIRSSNRTLAGTRGSLEFHKIRITFKHLRYACEFLADFYDKKKMQEVIGDMVKIQDLLGEHQDAATTVRILSRLKMAGKPGPLGKLIKIEKEYARQARAKFTKMYKSKRCGILKAGRLT